MMDDFMPLVRTYCATSFEDGIVFAHTYDAPDPDTAIKIAMSKKWSFLGEVDVSEASAELEAQMEKDLHRPMIH